MINEFQMPTKVVSGAGCAREIVKEAKLLNSRKVLVITDPGVSKTGLSAGVADYLRAGELEVGFFEEVESDPSIGTAARAAEAAKAMQADVVVAIGGGSSIDAGKSAALLVTNGGHLKDYAGVGKVRTPTLPLIAVPTTAGTGSEVTVFAVMSDPANNEKFTISSPLIAPRVAILDPEVTVKLPPSITAFTGMDALTHAVEAYGSALAQPATDALAIHAMKIIFDNLPIAVFRPDNINARQSMMQGALLAGVAFNNAYLGLAHAIASPLGGHFHVPHGLANAVMLPHVMEFNLPAAVGRYAEIAKALGLGGPNDHPRALADKAVSAITALARDIGIPKRLKDVGAREDYLPLVAHDALKSIQLKFNPRIATEQEILGVLQKAF